jgi:transposase-like protein
VFADLIRRGLDPATIQLGIMDGLPGVERAFLAAFRKATVQRCQVHNAKNVLVKVRKKDRTVVADDMRRVFYAGDALSAKRALERFGTKWKPMEIVAGEESVYRILAFVAMRMEMSWRNAPLRNSGFRKLKPFAGCFTYES